MRKLFMLSLFAFTILLPAGVKADVTSGKPAPDFTLTDIQGKSQTLASYKGKYVVLEWTNYDCPFVKRHYGTGNMQALQKTYTEKGVVWFSINSSAPGKQGNYAPEAWRDKVSQTDAKPTAFLLDSDGTVGHLYGAKTTPHVFIVNPEGILIYHGAIDNVPTTDPAEGKDAVNFVRQALDEAMSGQPVSEPSTQSYGCSVKY